MEDARSAGLPSLDDLAAEIVTLRQRLDDLERQMQALRGGSTVALPDHHQGAHPGLRAAESTSPAGATPFAQVLTADEDTARRHLEQLRAAIVRLREERAQAAAEFRTLARPLNEDAGAPASPETPAAVVANFVAADVEEPAAPGAEAGPLGSESATPEPDADLTLSIPPEWETASPRAADAANRVRVALDDVPDLRGPHEGGEEAWREVRQAVLQSEAWRERPEQGRRWLPAVLALGAAAALALVAYGTWNARSTPPQTSSAPAPVSTPPAPVPAQRAETETAGNATPPAPGGAVSPLPSPGGPIGTSGNAVETSLSPASPPPAVATPAPVATSRIEIQTTREVWMRTTVDGEPPVERLVPAGRVLKFDPAQVLLLRAGDAGGVRIVVDGEDRGVLGADGMVVTRRYELAPKKARP